MWFRYLKLEKILYELGHGMQTSKVFADVIKLLL